MATFLVFVVALVPYFVQTALPPKLLNDVNLIPDAKKNVVCMLLYCHQLRQFVADFRSPHYEFVTFKPTYPSLHAYFRRNLHYCVFLFPVGIDHQQRVPV